MFKVKQKKNEQRQYLFMLYFLYIFLFTSKLFADYRIPVTPTDPTVSHFEIKRGDGDPHYTGDLSYQIPLLTIPGTGNLNYDINLQYVMGNGVPASEAGSWVGLGWNLNMYQITCSPVSRHAPIGGSDYSGTYLEGANDMFYLKFPGGATPVYKFSNTWMPIKWSALKIKAIGWGTKSWSIDSTNCQFQDYSGFVVTDLDGTKYVFLENLKMTSRDSLKNRTFSAGGSGNYNQIYGIFNYVFKLSAILAPDYVDANGNLIPKDGGTAITVNGHLNVPFSGIVMILP